GVGVVVEDGVAVPRNPGRNYLSGDKGNDVIFGIGDRDSLYGGEGNDSLFMLSASATGELGLSADGVNTVEGARRELAGFPRNNWLSGGTGSDYIYSYGGDRGRQTMIGAEGDDSLFNRGSQVLVFGNTGVDYLETHGFTRSTLYGGQDNDTVVSGLSLVEDSTVTVVGGTNLLYGDKGNDTMLSAGIRDTLIGGNIEDNDTIAGNNLDLISLGGASSIGFGNQGNDSLVGSAASVSLYGGQDNDSIVSSGADSYLAGDKGNDTLILEDGVTGNTLIGGEGNDSLYAKNGGGGNLLIALTGDNVLVAGAADDTLIGGSGNDFLVGSDQADTLRADTPGVDTLEGFYGADSLIGTSGEADAFLFSSVLDARDAVPEENPTFPSGTPTPGDTITSFESGRDKIYLNLTGFGLDSEAIAGLRTNIDFFSTNKTTTYTGSFENLITGTGTTSAIVFDAQDQGGFLLWDANGAAPSDRNNPDEIVTIAVVSSGAITRNDIFLF
ncbi:MAG TPA: calcium-binding protein, partial [Vampirovibrionales bacterium]